MLSHVHIYDQVGTEASNPPVTMRPQAKADEGKDQMTASAATEELSHLAKQVL